MKKIFVFNNEDYLTGNCGSKAQNLHIAYKMWPFVPYGIVLPVSLFNNFCDENGIVNFNQTYTGLQLSASIEEELGDIWDNMRLQELVPLIVRSSACEEDGTEASFAGIYDSIAPVHTFDDFKKAVLDTWLSYFTESAVVYRDTNNISAKGMALLIQKWLVGGISGVLFFDNPINNTEQIVIDAVMDTNDSMVSHRQDATCYIIPDFDHPENYFIYNNSSDILNKDRIEKLCCLAKRFRENGFKHMDIEWVFYEDQLYVLQIRPITTGKYQESISRYSAQPTGVENCCLLDRYSEPATPAYLSLLDYWQNHVYLDLYSQSEGDCFKEKPLLFFFNRVYWNMNYQKDYFDQIVLDYNTLKNEDGPLYHLMRNGACHWYSKIDTYLDNIRSFNKIDMDQLLKPELNCLLNQVINNFCEYIGKEHYQMLGMANLCYGLLKKTLLTVNNSSMEIACLLRTEGMNKTTESNNQLFKIAEFIKSDDRLTALFASDSREDIFFSMMSDKQYDRLKTKFTAFIDEHGHRGTSCDDLYFPHWFEEPVTVIELIRQYYNMINNQDERSKDTITSKTDISKDGIDNDIRELAEYTSIYMNLREDQRYYFDMSWVLLRRIYLRIGSMMVQTGIIDRVEDVFFLLFEELQLWLLSAHDGTDWKPFVSARRKAFDMAKLRIPPYFIRDGKLCQVQKRGRYKSYKVTVISTGYSAGIARIIKRYDDLSKVRKGDIIVVPTFHPSWTPVLRIVSGIIMSYGNILSHGAVVAREYGTPVVVFNEAVELSFEDGQEVEIDAINGRVRIHTNVSLKGGTI